MTQEALAEHAGVSVRTIADIERGVIRAPRRDTLDLLARALDLSEDERKHWGDLRSQLSMRTTTGRQELSIPSPPNALIGRGRELSALANLLTVPTRLITVTGPGGVGKTRIVQEAGHTVSHAFSAGTCFVELASIRSPELVLPTIAHRLDIREGDPATLRDRLVRYLDQRKMLLILDNFEHLRQAARDLAHLLAHTTTPQFLVTSRARLRIAAEHEFQIHPLQVPTWNNTLDMDGLHGYPAIDLFLERSGQVSPDLKVTSENAEAISRICAYLDGLPLAIELAAARTRVLSPRQIEFRLTNRLGLLTEGRLDAPDRHQTMAAAIDWSYDLLDPNDQFVFRQFSAFVGGWSLEAAESMIPPGIDVLDCLARLCNDNLVVQSSMPDGSFRFGMLETVREFGLQQLVANGELQTARRAHARCFLELAERAEPGLRGADQVEWIGILSGEQANVRAALDSTIDQNADPETGLQLAAALTWFWETVGQVSEGGAWLNRALEHESDDPAIQMRALAGAGWLAHIQQDSAAASEHLGAGLRIAESIDDRWWIAWTLHLLGRVAYFDGDPDSAIQYAVRSGEIAWELDDGWLIAWDEHLLGLAAFIRGDLTAARAHYERSLEIRESIGYQEGIALMHGLLGVVHLRETDWAGAWRCFRKGLELSRPIGARWLILNWLGNIVQISSVVGEFERAARLAGFVDSLTDVTGALPIPITSAELQRGIETARAAIGNDEFEAHFDIGQRMTVDDAISDAYELDGAELTEQQ